MSSFIRVPRQSMARWVGLAAEWLRPIYQLIIGGVLDGSHVQVDETVIKYLEPGHGQTRQGYLWVVNRPRHCVFFHWEASRTAACLERIIPEDFAGILQCDGYGANRDRKEKLSVPRRSRSRPAQRNRSHDY